MGLYTRQQLTLLLLLLGAAGVGLAVSHWRAGYPELVQRLEHIDREAAASEDAVAARAARVTDPRTPARRVTDPRAPARRPTADQPLRTPAPPRAPKRLAIPNEEHHAPLDLNRATLVDLTRLPGVGPILARRILDTREAAGRFTAVDDLAVIRGVSRSKLDHLRPFVDVLEPPSDVMAPAAPVPE